MSYQKKVDQYIFLAKELFLKKDNENLLEGEEGKYQTKLSKIWKKLSKKDKKKVELWIEESLVQQQEKKGIKHLIECNCSLPQFRDRKDRVFHRFLVFSIIDKNNQVIPKHVQCNNCGAIHKIVEIGKSEFTGKEESHVLLTIEDVKHSIPKDIREVLDNYNLDLPYWEETAFLYEHKRWGSHIILSSEYEHGDVITKIIRFISPETVKIETLTNQVIIS